MFSFLMRNRTCISGIIHSFKVPVLKYGWETSSLLSAINRCTFSSIGRKHQNQIQPMTYPSTASCLQLAPTLQQIQYPQTQNRSKTTFSRTKGRSHTVTSVRKRFFRLYNGLWIRPKSGRHNFLYKKNPRRVHRLQQHVFCSNSQGKLLDKMVDDTYKVPRYYPNDPYEHYHKKTNLRQYRNPPREWYP